MHRKAIAHLRAADATLARVIDRVGRCHFTPNAACTHFDAVVRAIVYQQLSGSAAHTIYSRVLALYGGNAPAPSQLLATPTSQLRAAGLSRQKIGYLSDLAAKTSAGDVPMDTLHELSDDEVVQALTCVKGVGRWTAQMFLMFRLGRPNVLPDLDLGIKKGIQRAYRLRALPSEERVRRLGRKWEPYCSVASWYLWHFLDMDGAAGSPASTRQSSASRARTSGASGASRTPRPPRTPRTPRTPRSPRTKQKGTRRTNGA
jgi:DNA-3-methyladenine glycosylase II